MRLVLFRHGIAIDREDPDCPTEEERHLTAAGIERTRAAALGLARLRLQPDRILSSPWLRARQTAALAAEALGFDPSAVELTEALLPNASPSELLDGIRVRTTGEILVCGHAPHLDEVLAELVGIEGMGGTRLKKAGAAALEFTSTACGHASLEWMIPPRVLRELSGA